ncbi:GLUG motif-containing protein [Sedimentisphaera salicampi]|uniref:GLUG domain-containing protein n=1 Tax=Sedimentisphaera salicampi TaxID=1941349 RepID=A0A1W6LN23_9BACT|nr:GLUG motif-containing protein [Sedimentisphaera salicampi]ARN57185.1 hypothetical protein STSP1_01582 [Sedimentisphaera salicampi]
MCILRVSVIAALAAAGIAFGFAAGDGTANNPYQISTPDHLEAVNNDLSAHYVLKNDIDLSARTYDRAVIAPDTDYTDSDFNGSLFSGSFDGAGYKILNLTVDTSNVTKDYPRYLGLLGKIDGGEVRNLGIENAQITGGDNSRYLGGLCGYNREGTITNCYATSDISGFVYPGGLCGYNDDGIITNCYVTGSVSGGDNSYYPGGLCGYTSGTITNCYATGSVSGGDRLGGLCGWNSNGTIENCYATGSVSGGDDSHRLGGLCGFNSGTIASSYATGSVSGGSHLGGLCGYNYEGTIRNCYATGSVSGKRNLGGLCGVNLGTITSCFWDKEASGIAYSYGGTGITTAQMQTLDTFTSAGWDYVNEDTNGQMDLWYQHAGEYPKLFWQAIPGDISYDGYVGEADMIIMAEQWLQAPPEQTRLEADSNFDEYVDILDFAIFSENWLLEN